MSQTIDTSKPSVFFPNLDGLRFLAFFMVFGNHCWREAYLSLGISCDPINRFVTVFSSGSIGVNIFFVLSGFLITYLLLTEKKWQGTIDVKAFYARRFLRIWPLYYAVLIFGFIVYPLLKAKLGIHTDLASRWPYFFSFLSNFDVIHIQHTAPGNDAMMQNITWSVAVEEQFYLLWPLLFFSIPQKWYAGIFAAVIGVSVVFRWFHVGDSPVLYFHSLSVMGYLGLGGLSAFAVMNSTLLVKLLATLPRWSIALIYMAGIAALMYLPDDLPNGWVLMQIPFGLFFAFVILEQNFSNNSFFKFKQFSWFSWWGKYTYGLYLLHPIAILIVEMGLKLTHLQPAGFPMLLAKVIGTLGVALLLAYTSYEFFEKPFLRFKQKFQHIKSNELS